MKTKRILNTQQLTLLSILVAINIAISRFFLIPIPLTHGNINLCDTGIFIAAWLFGANKGALVGGLSGLLLDLVSGYPQYMIFSLVVHGIEGFVAGKFTENKKITINCLIVSLVFGTATMVLGYFIADSILYKFSTGIASLPLNAIQGVIGSFVALPLFFRLRKLVK